jgi:hypothetical protein
MSDEIIIRTEDELEAACDESDFLESKGKLTDAEEGYYRRLNAAIDRYLTENGGG